MHLPTSGRRACSDAARTAAVFQVLRLALYELEYEGLPPHAVDEHVGLVRRLTNSLSSGYAPGFVNGVLREAARRIESKTLPSPQVRCHRRYSNATWHAC